MASRLSLPPIPTYRIDMALPPALRYVAVAKDFAPKMQALTHLFNDVLCSIIPWPWLARLIEWLSAFLLRSLYSAEETAELKGIAKESGIALHLLIALNVLLDSLLGCTSGGVLVAPKRRDGEDRDNRLMHFRTLDWGMDELRDVLVVLEFCNSKSTQPTKVIARSISYAGFIGVLTGVRGNLSLSLNFRPFHRCSTFSLRLHQVLVALGFRKSISSVLRDTLLLHTPVGPESITKTLASTPTAPCYLIFCTSSSATIIEKDLRGPPQMHVRTSDTFIVQTNHDVPRENQSANADFQVVQQKKKARELFLEIFFQESEDRMNCVEKKWDSLKKRTEKKSLRINEHEAPETKVAVREETLKGWVTAYPIMNESTHFGCILDPKMGSIRWLERGE